MATHIQPAGVADEGHRGRDRAAARPPPPQARLGIEIVLLAIFAS